MGKKMYLQQSTESSQIWAGKFLEEFCASGNDSHTFDTSLTNIDRGIIHNMCRKMGLRSKSSGSGDQRCLQIFRRVEIKKRDANEEEKGSGEGKKKSSNKKLKCVSFPPEAKPVLQDLFTRYPPCDGDTTGISLGIYTGHLSNQRKWKDDYFCKPHMSKEDILSKAAFLSSKLANDKRFGEIYKARANLPIASFRDAIISAVESNQVVLIAGETGCGKTTQVPQYLLDHMWYSKQESCKIICTQPRRISAISVSERLSWERGEVIGNSIGYKVRLKSKGGRQSSVVFCTNGILLRVLVGKGGGSCIPDITHIIVDEIHERDCYSDFMLAIIRDFLPANPHLRLILMSATLDAERFSGYFGGCPIVQVPGFTYPVRTYYLEDALSVLKSDKNNHLISADSNNPDGKLDIEDGDKVALDEAIDLAWKNDDFDALLALVSSEVNHDVYNYRQSSTWLTPLMVFAGKGRTSDVCKLLLLGADCKLKSKEGITALELAEKENQSEAAQIIREHMDNFQANSQLAQDLLDKYMTTINAEEVDVDLIARLMWKICGNSKVGAILVFLPGWEEISKTKERLLVNPYFADSAKFKILCLHSRIPANEQKKVFQRPPKGCRKIVLATNIAESAVTIDDVVYVIDSGRMKEKSYDPYNNVSTLQSSWVSKANAKQREGRAGRCQPGICYHLYSKLRAASLPEFRVPEVRRMPVDELCLQVKMLDPSCNVHDFLQKLMDPPVDQSVANALTILKEIGALTPQEELTELGQKFGQLPVHPRISKMLYFAILVNCLDSALILACAAETKDPFIMPLVPGERKKAAAAKLELASLYGDQSDHLATVAAFHCWKEAKGRGQSVKFCSKYFVSSNAMNTLDNLRDKLHGELKRHGLIPSNDSNCSLNAHDPGILRAVVAIGLYPMVGRMCPPSKNNKRSLVETITGAKVRVPWNSNKSSSKDDEPLIVFDEITQGDWGVHIRSYTALPTVPLLLFSGEIAVAPTESCNDEEDHEIENEGDVMDIDKAAGRPGEKIMLAPENSVKVVVDRWLPFKITAIEIAQMYILRERLMASILFKVKHPQENLPPHLGASMYAIACILSYDGLLKPSFQTVAVEPSASVVDTTGLREDIPSADHNESQGNDPNTTPTGSKLESANMSGLGNMEESLSSNLANGNEQPDPNTALTKDASAVKEPKKKKRSRSKKVKENKPSDLTYGTEQTELKPADTAPNTDPTDLDNMEECLPSNPANGNEQPYPKTASTEAASAVEEPEKKRSRSKKRKAANNLDLGNTEEDKPSDLADGNERTELKPADKSDLDNMEECLPSDPANGNEQPDPKTASTEAASVVEEPEKKRSRSKKRKTANNLDLGNTEENKPSDPADGNERTELKPADKSDLDNMEECLSSNPANGNEQPDPKTASTEAASAVEEPEKKRSRSKKRKAANNLDLGNTEENKPSDLADRNDRTELKPADKSDLDNMEECLPSNPASGNEQPDPNTALTEAASAAKQPKKKKSRSKRRKLDNNLNSDDNMEEEKMPSTNENEQPINTDLTQAASMANNEVQAEPMSVNKSDLIDVKSNENPFPNSTSTEAASVENN
ncbi:unnamed protein product [Arabis nemorensis]|uniref:RNA helicase n=1 Tax=Arabis nemorensis TaxID=586526 RepID=A0A565AMF5_9BRAS|nr:unnamed protein product [Arabis nemorensis]